MRISPSLANQMYLNYSDSADSSDSVATSVMPSGTYSKLAAAKYLKDNDKDHNGVLSCDEVSLSAEAYAKLDADADGKVTKAEMQEALAGTDNEIYQYYKNGGDQTHAKDVASSLLSSSNAGSAGANGYAKLAASRFLKDRDANGDGVLSAAEASLSDGVFAKIDKDSGGSISASELRTVLAGKNSTIQRYYSNGGTASLTDLTATVLKTI